jgi:Ser-tRNA(Ala) deacylase AlaX
MPELSGIPPTRLLCYEDAHVKEFDARVIKIVKSENGETGVVLDRTAFYPGGGGQPSDTGLIESDGMRARVVRLKRRGEIIIHFVDEVSWEIMEGDNVRGVIDWNRRYRLMRIHTCPLNVSGNTSSPRQTSGNREFRYGLTEGET